MTCLMIDVLLPGWISIHSHLKTSFFKKNFSFHKSKVNYSFFLLFMPACVVPLTLLSAWVTTCSQIRVGDHTPLRGDWWPNFTCAVFSVSIGWCSNAVSLRVFPLLYVLSAVCKITPDIYCIYKRSLFFGFARAQLICESVSIQFHPLVHLMGVYFLHKEDKKSHFQKCFNSAVTVGNS